MEIKEFQSDYTSSVLEIWFEASVKAHNFISENFWERNKKEMAEVYLPKSQTNVAFLNGHLAGFVSMVGDYLAALFVKPELQGKGIGTLLLEHVKSSRERIQLRVFKKNVASVKFYLKQNFLILTENIDKETGELEYLMEWKSQ